LRIVRALGARAIPTSLATTTAGGRTTLVVVERLAREGKISDDEAAAAVRVARAVAHLEHPNVARVREVAVRPDEIVVVHEMTDGERLSELWRDDGIAESVPPLTIALSILVDVLTGLSALHNMSDVQRGQPMRLAHGELTAANVLVGLDGVARVLLAGRIRRPGDLPEVGFGTLAPEVLAGETYDARADVYSVGALLWEALSGTPAFDGLSPPEIVESVRSVETERAFVPTDAPWAAPLADVAARAMHGSPDKRYPTAAAMAAEMRKVIGAKLTTPLRIASFIKHAAGDKILERRAGIEAAPPPRPLNAPPNAPPARPPRPAPILLRSKTATLPPPVPDLAATQAAPQAPEEEPAPISAASILEIDANELESGPPSRRAPERLALDRTPMPPTPTPPPAKTFALAAPLGFSTRSASADAPAAPATPEPSSAEPISAPPPSSQDAEPISVESIPPPAVVPKVSVPPPLPMTRSKAPIAPDDDSVPPVFTSRPPAPKPPVEPEVIAAFSIPPRPPPQPQPPPAIADLPPPRAPYATQPSMAVKAARRRMTTWVVVGGCASIVAIVLWRTAATSDSARPEPPRASATHAATSGPAVTAPTPATTPSAASTPSATASASAAPSASASAPAATASAPPIAIAPPVTPTQPTAIAPPTTAAPPPTTAAPPPPPTTAAPPPPPPTTAAPPPPPTTAARPPPPPTTAAPPPPPPPPTNKPKFDPTRI